MKFPDKLKYDENYNWVREEKGIAIIGIIEPAVKKTKELVFINLPKKGDKIKKGQNYASLEAVKWTGHIKSPLSGEVIEVNMEAYDEPIIVNQKPYESWLAKIKLSSPDELSQLMDSKMAEKHYEKEFDE